LPWRDTSLALQWIVRSGRNFLLNRLACVIYRSANTQPDFLDRFNCLPRLRSDSGLRFGLCYGPSNNFRFARYHWVGSVSPTAKLHRYHCSLVQLFKNTKVRLILQVTSDRVAFWKACFFNDLSESTKGFDGVQAPGLLKRRFVVEKWVGLRICLREAGTAGPSATLPQISCRCYSRWQCSCAFLRRKAHPWQLGILRGRKSGYASAGMTREEMLTRFWRSRPDRLGH
jgi:hypothetical protein